MLEKGLKLIAEIGGNHEGSFDKAIELADLAIEGGATIIKYQVYTGEGLVSKVEDPDRVKHFNRFALSTEQYLKLADYVETKGATFNASIWEKNSIDIFDKHMTFYKIGSGDLTAYQVISDIIKKRKPIILSSGLSNLEEVKETIKFIRQEDSLYNDYGMLGLLQCTAMYPIPNTEANLNVMDTYNNAFQNIVIGYSDHTIGLDAAKVAIAKGAEILEVHFTDEKEGRSFRDHQVSCDKKDLAELIRWYATVKDVSGSDIKNVTESEKNSGHVNSFRRAVYLNRDFHAGEEISEKDLVSLRPNHGIDARKYKELIGRKVNKSIKAHEKLSFEFLD